MNENNIDKVYNIYLKRRKGSIIRSKEYFNFMGYDKELAMKIGTEAACLLDYFDKFDFLSMEELREMVLPKEYEGDKFEKFLKLLEDNGLIEIKP